MTIHDRTIKSLLSPTLLAYGYGLNRLTRSRRRGAFGLLRSLLRAKFAWTSPPSVARCWNTHPPYPRGGIGAFDAPTFIALRLSHK